MGKIGGILLAALIAATVSASSATAEAGLEANARPASTVQGDMLAALRPLMTTLKASDTDLIGEAYGACMSLVFQDKDAYREGVMKQYEDVNLAVDHLTVAAAAKQFLCR